MPGHCVAMGIGKCRDQLTERLELLFAPKVWRTLGGLWSASPVSRSGHLASLVNCPQPPTARSMFVGS